MKPSTPAEQQMDELRRLRETLSKRKPAPAALPKAPVAAAAATSAGGFELAEAAPKKKKEGPSLALSPEIYRKLLERQRQQRSFKRRRDMGDWAAELLLALPFEAHRLSADAKAELFQRMQAWAEARGLR